MTNIINQFDTENSSIIELKMDGQSLNIYFYMSTLLTILLNLGLVYLIYDTYSSNEDLGFLSLTFIATCFIYINYYYFNAVNWIKNAIEIIEIEHSKITIMKFIKDKKIKIHTFNKDEIIEITYRHWSTIHFPYLPDIDNGNICIRTKKNLLYIAINLDEDEASILIKHLEHKLAITPPTF